MVAFLWRLLCDRAWSGSCPYLDTKTYRVEVDHIDSTMDLCSTKKISGSNFLMCATSARTTMIPVVVSAFRRSGDEVPTQSANLVDG